MAPCMGLVRRTVCVILKSDERPSSCKACHCTHNTGQSIGYRSFHSFPAGSRDTTIIVWDAVSGLSLARCAGHVFQVAAVTMLPNGEIVSASLDGSVQRGREGLSECRHVPKVGQRPRLSDAV